MRLVVALEEGRAACTETIIGFQRAVDGLTEYELLGASRCHGWTRLDAMVHVLAGWQEMLLGLVTVVDAEPTVDAASYWSAFAAEFTADDPVPGLISQRRRTAYYLRPEQARVHLRQVGTALRSGVDRFDDLPCAWQGHVFAAGDYLAVWAVENVVHQLDLLTDEPPPASAVGLARATIEALIEEPLPASWSDEEAVLIGTGRLPVPADQVALADQLPALG